MHLAFVWIFVRICAKLHHFPEEYKRPPPEFKLQSLQSGMSHRKMQFLLAVLPVPLSLVTTCVLVAKLLNHLSTVRPWH